MQNKYIVFNFSFDDVGLNSANGMITPDNTFDTLEKSKEYAERNKKPNLFQIIVDYQSNPKKIIEVVQ